MRHFDLCVIGSGPAGQRAAIQAAKLGKRACIIEREEVVGGAAINTGTIPSKALREAILHMVGRPSAAPSIADFTAARNATFANLLSSCQKIITSEIDLIRSQMASNGVDVVTGHASFREPHIIDVIGEHATTAVEADKFVIAVGTRPAKPAGMPFDGVNVMTSDDLLGLDFLPHSLIIVGGGVIGTEYASMLSALGVKVTLIEGGPRVLGFVDWEIVESLQYQIGRASCRERV